MGKAFIFIQKTSVMPAKKTEVKVPELVRKKQERDTKLAAALTKARADRKKVVAAKKTEWLNKGKTHWENYCKEQKRVVDESRKCKAEGKLFVPAAPKVVLVVRIKGINAMNPKTRMILRLLRLRQIHNATFMKLNKASMNMLRKVEPYVTYGFPNRKTVSDLVYGRGYGKVNGQRVKLNNNFLVEEALGKSGLTCNEDLVNELYTCGPNFKQANNFVWPFKLKCPKGGYSCKRVSYMNHGDTGDRDVEINSFVRKMI